MAARGGGGRGGGAAGASSSSAAAAAPRAAAAAVSTDGPLPYDGDRDLNRALQRALAANDTMAMRILFKAQKERARGGGGGNGAAASAASASASAGNGGRRGREEEEREASILAAMEACGIEEAEIRRGLKRKRDAAQEAGGEDDEDESKEERMEEDGDAGAALRGEALVEACKAALKRRDVGGAGKGGVDVDGEEDGQEEEEEETAMAPTKGKGSKGKGKAPAPPARKRARTNEGGAAAPSPKASGHHKGTSTKKQEQQRRQQWRRRRALSLSAATEMDLPPPPQLLRTLSNGSLAAYTQALSTHAPAAADEGAAHARRCFQAIRRIGALQHKGGALSSEAAALLKDSVGAGRVSEVETVLSLYGSAAATGGGGGGGGGNGATGEEGDEEEEEGGIFDSEDTLIEEFKCPLTKEVFWEPCSVSCGHSFELQAIQDHIKAANARGSGSGAQCPTCRAVITREEQKKLGVNAVLKTLLRRFYAPQMEALAEREAAKAAAGPAQGADRLVDIMDRYPSNSAIHELSLSAFEGWAHDAKARKHLASSDRVMTALVTLLREADDRLKGERTTEMGKAISSTRLLNLMALVGKDPRAAARLISSKMPVVIGTLFDGKGFLGLAGHDFEPTARNLLGAAVELARVLLSPDAWAYLAHQHKREGDTEAWDPLLPPLDEMTSNICNAAAVPAVRAHPERAKALLGCFHNMAELARIDGPLAFPVDFPTLVQGVTGIWDTHPRNSAIIAQAAKCLRMAAAAASPIHLPPETRSPILYLAQPEHWTRYVETYRTIVRGACDEGEEDDGDKKPSASSSSGGSASKGRKRGAGAASPPPTATAPGPDGGSVGDAPVALPLLCTNEAAMELVALMLTLACDDRCGIRDLDGGWDMLQIGALEDLAAAFAAVDVGIGADKSGAAAAAAAGAAAKGGKGAGKGSKGKKKGAAAAQQEEEQGAGGAAGGSLDAYTSTHGTRAAVAATAAARAAATKAALSSAAAWMAHPSRVDGDFRWEKVSDPARVSVSADGLTVQVKDMLGPAWAMGPTLSARDGQAFISFDLGGCGQKEFTWVGLIELDEATNAATGPGLDGSVDLLRRDATLRNVGKPTPFIVRNGSDLHARGESTGYMYLTGWRGCSVGIKIDMARRSASFGMARVGWESLKNKVLRPFVFFIPQSLTPTQAKKRKTKVKVTSYVVGFHCDPQPVALRPFPLPFPPSSDEGGAAAAPAPAPTASKKKKMGKPEEEKEDEEVEAEAEAGPVGSPFEQMGKGKIKLTQSATRYYGSLPPSFLPPNEAWPHFVYAVGKGEAPLYERELTFRFKATRRSMTSPICFGLLGFRYTGGLLTQRGSGNVNDFDVAHADWALLVLSTGHVTLINSNALSKVPEQLEKSSGQIRPFGYTARRQIKIKRHEGKAGTPDCLQVLSGALGTRLAEAEGVASDGELIFESRRLVISGNETIIPFVGLASPGDTASLKVVTDCAAPIMTREWVQTCLENLVNALPKEAPKRAPQLKASASSASVASSSSKAGRGRGSGKGKAEEDGQEGALVSLPLHRYRSTSAMYGAACARSAMWDGPPEYARTIFRSLATYTTGSLGKGEIPKWLGRLLPPVKRDRAMIEALGYDIDTLRLLARTCHLPAAAQAADASAAAINGGRGRGGRGGRDGRGVARITIGGGRGGVAASSAAASTGSGQKGEVRYEQANILALPKSVDETVALSRLFISGRAERVWLLGMAYSPDNDQYEIDSIQQLHPDLIPAAMRAAQPHGAPHEVFEIPLDPPYILDAGLCLGIAIEGEGAFIRGYTGSEFILGGRVALGPSDDVQRDMVLGKELYLEIKRIEGVVLGLGVDSTDGLPPAVYTTQDVKNGVYPNPPSSHYDNGESSDEEGRHRRRYHSSGSGRFDVILRDREPAHARGGATGANRGTPVPQAMGWRPVLMGFGGRMAPLIVGGRPGMDIEPNSETDTDESGSEYSGDEEDIMWG